MDRYKVIISGGGTGGHVYPAIAIADAFSRRMPKTEFLFIGAEGRMEMKKVPESGYDIVGLPIAGLQRRLSFDNIMLPFKVLLSVSKAKRIIKEFCPDIVIGTGGYASFPTLYAASKLDVAYFVQEQNSYPGITNKFLAKRACKIFVAYNDMKRYFPENKIVKTGNPVRENLTNTDDIPTRGKEFFNLDTSKKTLLVLGGSLGSGAINELVASKMDFFKVHDLQLIWQCGVGHIDKYKKYHNGRDVQVFSYLREMDKAYSAADIIISRAGAMAISELMTIAKPSILIPAPMLAGDHQTKNAELLQREGAVVVIKESEFDTKFEFEFSKLITDDCKIQQLSERMQKMIVPNADDRIVSEIISCVEK